MSCPRERELALYVEDDLPVSEVAALQAHVLDCSACRGFLVSLEASQRALKEWAAQPMADEALATVRARAALAPAADRRSVRLRWALAAVVTAALLPGLYLAVSRLRPPTVPLRAAIEERDHTAPTSMPIPEAPVAVVTAPPVQASVQQQLTPSRPRRPMKNAPTETWPDVQLTAEEADQLARALVAVSRIERLSDVDWELPAAPETPLVRIATDDPNVVIYWRLESSGGK